VGDLIYLTLLILFERFDLLFQWFSMFLLVPFVVASSLEILQVSESQDSGDSVLGLSARLPNLLVSMRISRGFIPQGQGILERQFAIAVDQILHISNSVKSAMKCRLSAQLDLMRTLRPVYRLIGQLSVEAVINQRLPLKLRPVPENVRLALKNMMTVITAVTSDLQLSFSQVQEWDRPAAFEKCAELKRNMFCQCAYLLGNMSSYLLGTLSP